MSICFFSACAPSIKPTEFVEIFIAEPEEYQHCADRFPVPSDGSSQIVVDSYVLKLREQAVTCHDAVERGRIWREGMIKKYAQ